MANTPVLLDVILDSPVKHVMTSSTHFITPDTNLKDVEVMMKRNHIRHLPVLDEDEVVGIITLTDLQRISFATAYGSSEQEIDDAIADMFTVEEIMHADPVTIAYNGNLRQVIEILANAEFHAVPVVDDGKLLGIITITDILRFVLKST